MFTRTEGGCDRGYGERGSRMSAELTAFFREAEFGVPFSETFS